MNRLCKIILLLILPAKIMVAQFDYDVTGYYVNYPILQKPAKELSQLFGLKSNSFSDLSRFRLRPVFYIGDNSRINLEYEINALYLSSTSQFDLFTTPTTNHQVVDLSWNIINHDKVKANHFIDRLYFKHSFEFGSITIGRQRIAWGTGRVWNPIDLFNPVNPANFAKIEKDGADAVSFKWNIGNFTDLHFVYGAVKKLSNSNFAARFRSNVGEYDFSIVGGRIDQKFVAGTDLAGNLFDAGIRAEALYSFEKENQDSYVKYILGIDYQFTSKLYALIEYHYNGEGASDKTSYELTRLLNSDILNLAKNYINITSAYQLTPLLNLSASNTLNLDDNSGYTTVSGEYSLSESLFFTLGAQVTYGKTLAEYWYFPASYYAKFDVYF